MLHGNLLHLPWKVLRPLLVGPVVRAEGPRSRDEQGQRRASVSSRPLPISAVASVLAIRGG